MADLLTIIFSPATTTVKAIQPLHRLPYLKSWIALNLGNRPAHGPSIKGVAVKETKVLHQKIINEMGHDMGLQHCSNPTCIMAKADGEIASLLAIGPNLCGRCIRKSR